MTNKSNQSKAWKRPVWALMALVLILVMLRLGVWQLGRADEKQSILDELLERSEMAPVELYALSRDNPSLRFRPVTVVGEFQKDKTVFVDRQVSKGRVGYQVFTPLRLADGESVLVARGWVPVGVSRESLPTVATPDGQVSLRGRLNTAPPKPPLWDDRYPVSQGAVWQYLPMQDYADQMRLKLFPLVLELAPDTNGAEALEIDWPTIDDRWVAKHKGYAFQWFAMAFTLLIFSLFLQFRSLVTRKR